MTFTLCRTFAANHIAARFPNVRDVAQTTGTPHTQGVRVQRNKRRRVSVRDQARRDPGKTHSGRAGPVRLRVSIT